MSHDDTTTPDFTPTESQSAAIDRVVGWYGGVAGRRRGMLTPDDQVMRLFGFAGSGKTTLVKHIVAELGLSDEPDIVDDSIDDPDDPFDTTTRREWVEPTTRSAWVAYGAYTGKAVHVLRRKGIETATTIHRMMYRPQDKSRHHLHALEKELSEVQPSTSSDPSRIRQLEAQIAAERKRVRSPSFAFDPQAPVRSASLIVLDEVSMVNEKMAFDLLSFGVPVLALGDPAQLPPVGGDGWFTDATPDVLLTEIHRSALESPVTRIATAVRESGPASASFGISGMDSGSGRVGKLSEDHLYSHDIVLCWRNSVRWNMITAMRARMGRPSGVPVMGDVIMVLANNAELGVFNGQIFTVLAAMPDDPSSPYIYELAVEDDSGSLRMLDVYACGFTGKSGEDDAKDMVRFGGEVAAATFAQAITVHKCVTPDTFVETSLGLQRIADIDDAGTIATPHGAWDYHGKFTRSTSPVRTITTRHGYRLTATLDHGVTVFDPSRGHDRVEMRGIREGDWVRLARGVTLEPEAPKLPKYPDCDVRATRYRYPEIMNQDVAEFLGLIVADGTVYNGGFRLAKRYHDVVDRFADLCSTLFGAEVRRFEITGTPAAEVPSTEIVNWLRPIGGMAPHAKHVPGVVLRSPGIMQAAFIRGFAEDGTVNVKRRGVVDHIEITNRSADVLRTVAVMLLRLNITCSVVDGPKVAHLYIYGRDNLAAFRDRVGFVASAKNARLGGSLPSITKTSVVPVTRDELEDLRPHMIRYEKNDISRLRRNGYIPRSAAMRMYADGATWLADRLEWHYDRVSSITESESETMCVTVPDEHRFLQNGFDGWNSQGSQWPSVLVIDETPSIRGMKMKMSGGNAAAAHLEASRWLYTAVSRAETQVTIARL